MSSKLYAAKVMWNLTQDRANLQILPRSPRVLDALVGVASSKPSVGTNPITRRTAVLEIENEGSDDEDNEANSDVPGRHYDLREEIRRLALKTLVQFTTLACNRRVLARQVGLLSCLIRFVRTLDETEEEFAKEELKENILKLALLL
mmetsp:Transcript_3941/g.5700  ORF Transcript_3941/g.5700 Transcript_3941/m.5700 type:complete len:147 (-) Transcript_3941:21-461(-)